MSGALRSGPAIDFSGSQPPLFVGTELDLAGKELTIFGRDLPEFRTWAAGAGARAVRHVAEPSTYSAGTFDVVAHRLDGPFTLDRMAEIEARIEPLLARARRLLLFVEIADLCTIETIGRAFHAQMPDLTFRIIYPRAVYRASGMRAVLVERRLPRIFLFLTGKPKAGKTETALLFGAMSDVTVVHGDEWFFGIRTGSVEALDSLRRRIDELHNDEPFDRALFADFLMQIPAFQQPPRRDIVFDFLMPSHKQADVMRYFQERGFFPILCQTPHDQDEFRTAAQELAHQADAYRKEAQFLRAKVDSMRRQRISRRISDPLRALGRNVRAMAKAGWQRLRVAGSFKGAASRAAPARGR